MRRLLPLALGGAVAALVGVAVAASRHAEPTQSSPLRPDGGWSAAWTLSLVAAFALYVGGLLLLRRAENRTRAVIAVAVAIQLLPLASPVLLSRDVYLYWIFGRIGAVHGGDPYVDTPSEFPQEPAYEETGSDWRRSTFPYGPVFAGVAEVHAAAAGDSTDDAMLFYKLLGAALVVACAVVVGRTARDGPFAAALVGWNPLLAIHFAGGGHNDALMILPVLAALVLAARGRAVASGVGWAVGAAVKWVPLVFLPLELLRDRRRRALVVLGSFVTASALIAVVAALRYDSSRTAVAASISRQTSDVNSLSTPFRLMEVAGAPERLAILFCAALFAAAYGWLLWQAWRGRARHGLAAGLLLLAVPWPQPWYALWPLGFSALDEDRAARVLAVALSAYYLRDALPS